MSFSTYEFIFIFLPVTLGLYFLLPVFVKNGGAVIQQLVLVGGAAIFILMYNVEALVLIVFSTFANFILSKFVVGKKGKQILATAIVLNIALLGYFKYCNFFIDNVNAVFLCDIPNIELFFPLGISFYTFQQIAYIVGVYKTKEKINGVLDYVTYVTFFPKLLSGPLMNHEESLAQFANRARERVNFANLSAGLYIFCIGLFKKTVISDTVALFADTGFAMAGELSFFQAWVTALSYSFQIYFDFSGYSDMAIGTAKMFNVDLPFNFNSPYKATSITEFWRRWHITLSSLLSQLIYIPLGGNRKGTVRTYLNLMAVFLVSGLWHGASWTFVLWGLFHGIIECVERVLKRYLQYIPKIVRQFFTFIAATLLWVMFRVSSVSECLAVYRNMFSFTNMSWTSIGVLANDGIIPFSNALWSLYVLVIFGAIIFVLSRKKNSNVMYTEFTPTKKNIAFVVVLFAVSLVHLSRLSVFVYSNF